MAQEEMETDLQPVAGDSVESPGTLPAAPAGHAALSSGAPALGEGAGSVTALPADDAAVIPNAATAREAAPGPNPRSSPTSALNGLQRLQGASDPYQPLPALQRPRVRRARRQQRIGGSQRTVSAR